MKPAAVLDVGSHVGRTVERFADELDNVPIHAFEPTPSSAAALRLCASRLRHVSVHELALGDRAGVVPLFLNRFDQTNSLLDNARGPRSSQTELAEHVGRVDVRVATLDEWCAAELPAGDLVIKADVQGAEGRLVAGGRGVFGAGRVVAFYSEGYRLAASLYRASTRGPAIVFCPGSRVTRRTPYYATYVPMLVDAGITVLLVDYRGWGDSEGPAGELYPLRQVEDIRNALTYLASVDVVDPGRLGLFGVSMGGAHAVTAAALDERVKATIAVLSPMDGAEMLRRSRREYEWQELRRQLSEDRSIRVAGGAGGTVDALGPVTPERARSTAIAQDTPPPLPLACVAAIHDYRPLDLVSRISPRAVLWIAATHDPVCPVEHSRLAYAAALPPKRLVEIDSDEHYGTYTAHRATIVAEAIAWYRTFLVPDTVVAREAP